MKIKISGYDSPKEQNYKLEDTRDVRILCYTTVLTKTFRRVSWSLKGFGPLVT